MTAADSPAASSRPGWRARLGSRWQLPSLLVGVLLIAVGGLAWLGFSATMAWTNTETFCVSCHEMRANVYEEYRETIHDRNAAGVRATCIDCHVPAALAPKLAKKIRASKDVMHHLLGTLDTREKFRARRQQMAQAVWVYMKATDSRECRACHVAAKMDLGAQNGRAARKHEHLATSGKTCIDCHKGIAHTLPDEYTEEEN